MTTTESPTEIPTDHSAASSTAPAVRTRRKAVLPVVSMLLVTLAGALAPLVRTPDFYYWDDTAGVAVGQWQRIAETVLQGSLPFLQLDMWRGGNFAAEAATGMWNPVMLALMLGTYPIDNVAVAITVAKIALFLLTAAGVYLLARSYGAVPWMAAAAGTALSLSGWAIFMDGTSWINGTAITALTPWAWWALRKSFIAGFRPWWSVLVAVALGTLVGSTGNPYGLLTLTVVYAAVAVEALVRRRPRAILWLVVIGAATALLVAVVYLPFLFTSAYGNRANSGIWNDEFLSVSLSNLLGMSSPTHRPYIMMWGNPMGFPGTYLAWFVLPLLPWLKWDVVRQRGRELSSVLVFALVFLAFTLGPSQLGMFRWPARLVPFFYMAVIVLFAVLASAGLHRSQRRARSLVSGAIILAGAWMAFSDVPGSWKWHGLVTLGIAGGVAAIVFWARSGARAFLVMALGTLLFMVPQLALTASNQNVADYEMPSSKRVLTEQFADRSDGLVVQVFDVQQLVGAHPAPERWDDLLAGSMPSVAGYESTTAYSGIGFTAFDGALCMTYNGGTCAGAWDALWDNPDGADRPLADFLRAKYVVVLNDFADNDRAPEGWTQTERTDVVTIYERDDTIPFEAGTASVWGSGVTIDADERSGSVDESLTVSTEDSDTELVFARIAWPGYTVLVDGEQVPTSIGPAGLLTVDLPPGLQDADVEVRFVPPGLYAGLAAAGVGVVLAVLAAIFAGRPSRRAQAVSTR